MTDKSNKLWDGRFTEATDAFVESFTASIGFDQVLAAYDIQGSIAHATMLEKVGILNDNERGAIVSGLEAIREDIRQGKMTWSVALEDVHMNIESQLTERIGDVGKKLHTGRSRNDQVATDIRLYLRDAIDAINEKISLLQKGILDLAEGETETIMPGLTHLQVAQPISFAHHLMAWFEMIARDKARMADCRQRVNSLPLGAAALAGTTYPIDRQMTAELLGFETIAANSLDAVSDRDFAIEFCAASSLLMMHLSRWAEEMILWTSPQFSYIDLPDRFCTGSSIMPQKKNPDVPELVRGKTGRVFGSLSNLLTVMKGQALAYNKDNQEDKEPLFDTVNTVLDCLTAFADMIPAMTPNRGNMREATRKGFATATDLADYLVKKGLPFRDAHDVVGRLVGLAISKDCDLSELALEDLSAASDLIEQDVYEVLTLEGSLNARNHLGGTAPEQVKSAIKTARHTL
ncbi:MAG: argininosuccinate lyase [Pseudomonadales bacterium]|nr:argininosuccinate lyase [Pseudomonadales bacterium]MBO7006061.1 argininosuccinate lyase [Pseudomonadales bacterium]